MQNGGHAGRHGIRSLRLSRRSRRTVTPLDREQKRSADGGEDGRIRGSSAGWVDLA